MAQKVVVTRRGQTTIPTKIRRRLGIQEGTRLKGVRRRQGHTHEVQSLFDLAGTSRLSRAEAFKQIDRMREEE